MARRDVFVYDATLAEQRLAYNNRSNIVKSWYGLLLAAHLWSSHRVIS